MRRGKQAFDQFLVGILPLVRNELVYLFDRRRQSEKIQAKPPNQRGTVGLRRRRQVLFFQPGQHKTVDGIANPTFVFDFGLLGTNGCLKSPVIALVRIRGDFPFCCKHRNYGQPKQEGNQNPCKAEVSPMRNWHSYYHTLIGRTILPSLHPRAGIRPRLYRHQY